MADKGPGATPLREPFQDAFAAGFFEDKPSFDKALQVGRVAGVFLMGAGRYGCLE